MHKPVRHTLDQLEVLDAIDTTGSFAGAARLLHRVPSAISHTVARLEDSLGVALFDRSGHRAVLTAAGHRVLASGRDVLAAARRLDVLADGLDQGWEPTLQVVVDGALPMPPLLRALRRFIAAGHPTRIRLDVEHRQGVIARWQADEADLMCVLGLDEADGVVVSALPPLPMVLVTAPDHPLGRAPTATRADLAPHVELLVRDSAPTVRDGAEAWFGTAHQVHLSDFPTKRLALLEGLGFGWMPRALVEDDLEQGVLTVIALPDAEASWTFSPLLVRRADHAQGPASQAFEALLLAAMGGQAPLGESG